MLAALLAGCGVKTVGDLDDGSESGDSSAEGSDGHTSVVSQTASDSDSATGEESSASMSTTDPSTSTTDPTDTETDSGECPPGGSICDPQPEIEADAAAWSIDDNQGFEAELTDVLCTVADFQDDGATMTIELHCDEEELAAHTIVLPHNPITPLNLGIDTGVRLSYYAQTPFWTNYWFAIHRLDGGLIVGGAEADSLLPPDNVFIFASVGMSVRDDVCPQECIVDECGATRRHAIDVTFDADETTVYDRTIGVIGQTTQYTIVVGDASGFVDFGQCTDIPGAWYRVIVYDSSEG